MIMAAGLIPLALIARVSNSSRLQELVQKLAARAWRTHDATKLREP